MSGREEQKKSLFEKYPVYFGVGGALLITCTLLGTFIWKTRKMPESEDNILDDDNESPLISPSGANAINIL
jgi:hypothetical protein